MAIKTKTVIKSFFETGDKPTSGNYIDFIDSTVFLNTPSTGSMNLQGTGSFERVETTNISASGFLTATTGSFGRVETTNISASGILHVNEIQNISTINHDSLDNGNLDLTSAGTLRLRSTNSTSYGLEFFGGVQNSAVPYIDTDSHTTLLFKANGTERIAIDSPGISLFGNVTASLNISASGFISAEGNSVLKGLPTTEPSTTGSLWLSGSAGNNSKHLVVFTG